MKTTTFSNNYLDNTDVFEDATGIMPWRYDNTKKITYSIFKLYSKRKHIDKFYKSYGKGEKFIFVYNFIMYLIKTKEYIIVAKK